MEAVVRHRHPGSKLHFIGEGERQVGPVVDGRRAKEHTQLHVNEKEEENGESVRPCHLVCSSKRQRDESCKKRSKQGLRESRDRKSSRKRERERERGREGEKETKLQEQQAERHGIARAVDGSQQATAIATACNDKKPTVPLTDEPTLNPKEPEA